uniref:Uncharacterized protein n=1 Tax=Tanacetum cinerariifolium TaxID=118510 RepID=A0A699IK64_TANCI|nr:hypothetical protein [Tanacetum cinerariifolium]
MIVILINVNTILGAKYVEAFVMKQLTVLRSTSTARNEGLPTSDPQNPLKIREPYSTKIIKLSSLLQEEKMYMSLICHLLMFAKASPSVNWIWHKRLSHINFNNINKLAKQNIVADISSLTFSKDKTCSACKKGKHHRASFKTKRLFSINKCYHLLHMNLFGPVKPQTISHNKHTLVIVDEYSRKMENLNEVMVKELTSDNETEFRNHKLEYLCNEKEALNSACYTQNKSIIVKRHGKTAYDVFRGTPPNISYFYVFDCPVHIHNHKDHLGKFDKKADDGLFLGYSLVAKVFSVFNIRRQEMKETYHVTFNEDDEAISQSTYDPLPTNNINIPKNNITPTNSLTFQDSVFLEELHELTIADDHPTPDEPDHFESGLETLKLHQPMNAYMLIFFSEIKPKKLIEAFEEEGWIMAMQEELNLFERNNVLTLVLLYKVKPLLGPNGYERTIWMNMGLLSRIKQGWLLGVTISRKKLTMIKPLHLLQDLKPSKSYLFMLHT